MKKLIPSLAAVLLTLSAFSQSFVSPIGFVETEASKADVLAFIKKQVKDDYTKIGMNDPSTLRMMEEENLKAFKELITVTNIPLLKQVMKTYCDIGMCNYTTILMMYKQQNKDSNKSTQW